MTDYELLMRWIYDICEDQEDTDKEQFDRVVKIVDANRKGHK